MNTLAHILPHEIVRAGPVITASICHLPRKVRDLSSPWSSPYSPLSVAESLSPGRLLVDPGPEFRRETSR